MLLSAEYCMSIKCVEIPSGLMKEYINRPTPAVTKQDIKNRKMLEKAVDDAELNITERMALNKRFFPNGGGFNIFPNIPVQTINIFYKRNSNPEDDEFIRETKQLEFPNRVCRVKWNERLSKKDSFQANLDNAIKKLRKTLK